MNTDETQNLKRGRRRLLFLTQVGTGIIELYPEIAARVPAEVKFKLAVLVTSEWQENNFPPRDREIPTAVGIRDDIGIAPAAHGFFVGDANDVKSKIMERIAEIPFRDAVRVGGQIPCGRHRLVGSFQPPDGIELVVEMDFRQSGLRHHFE